MLLKEKEKREEEERIRSENLLQGNPLLNQKKGGDFRIKRRSFVVMCLEQFYMTVSTLSTGGMMT